jgi:ribosomal protein L40E
MRPGELLSLRVGNVTVEDQFGEVSLDGKTGIRSAFIIRNLAYLVQWLDSYECRKDPNAPLWPDFEKPGEPLSYAGLRQMLKRLAVRAKIKKRVYPYIFRHSQATSDCQEIPEPIMRKLYGWSKSSKTPSRYEHLSGKDARLARLKQAGIIVEEDKKLVRLCPRCKRPNPAAATMCHACGSVLSIKTAVEIQEDRDKLRKDVEELKATVNALFAAQMKPGQKAQEVLAQVEARKTLARHLKKAGLVEKEP